MYLRMDFHIQLRGKLPVRNLRAYREIIKTNSNSYEVELHTKIKSTHWVAEVFGHKDIQDLLHTQTTGTLTTNHFLGSEKGNQEIVNIHYVFKLYINIKYYQRHIRCRVPGRCSLLLHNLWTDTTLLRHQLYIMVHLKKCVSTVIISLYKTLQKSVFLGQIQKLYHRIFFHICLRVLQ